MNLTVKLTLLGLGLYVAWALLEALWLLVRGDADDADLDRIDDVLASGHPHRPGHSPYSTTDATKGIWCPWCECYHAP